MNRFMKYLLIVTVSFCILDLCNRCLFVYLFNHMPVGTEAYNTYKFKYNTEPGDVLVLGASRAQHHFVPQIFLDSLNMTCYNAGVDGQPVTDQYMELLHALELGTPKMVIMDIAPSQLEEEWTKEKYSQIGIFFWENANAREVVKDISGMGHLAYIAHLSSFYQYNSQIFLLYDLFVQKRHSRYHGYDPKAYTGRPWIVNVKEHEEVSSFVPYPPAIRYLDKMVALCQHHSIPLTITVTPCLIPMKPGFHEYLEAYCQQNHISFWNDVADSAFVSDPYLWFDNTHMNERGAEQYTKMIMSRINNSLI